MFFAAVHLASCCSHWYSGPRASKTCDHSLNIEKTGYHVPYNSLFFGRAAWMPDAIWPVSGFPQDSSRDLSDTPVSTSSNHFQHLRRFTYVRLQKNSPDQITSGRFPSRFRPPLLTADVGGGLPPASRSRRRGAFPHLLYSIASYIHA